MIEIPFVAAFLLSLYAGIYDLKTSDIFEEVPALMVSFGLFYWYIVSLFLKDFSYFLSSVTVGIFLLSFGLILFKLKLWGDGDAWILGGIGFMVPFLHSPFSSIYPFLLLFSVLLVGAIYSLVYILIYGLLDKKIKKKFSSNFNKNRSLLLGFLIPCLAASIYVPFLAVIGALPIIYVYSKTVEENMKKRIKTSELKEGDVVAGKEIVGVTREDIKNLRNKQKSIEIQEGVRFTMVFPISLLILYILL